MCHGWQQQQQRKDEGKGEGIDVEKNPLEATTAAQQQQQQYRGHIICPPLPAPLKITLESDRSGGCGTVERAHRRGEGRSR